MKPTNWKLADTGCYVMLDKRYKIAKKYILRRFQKKENILPTGMPSTRIMSPIPAGAIMVVCQ